MRRISLRVAAILMLHENQFFILLW